MSSEKILIPDIGDFDSVDVIEVLVNIGDTIEYDMPLITVESDKASMDIPAPKDGVIKDLKIKVDDKVKEGSLIGLIEVTETKKTNRRTQTGSWRRASRARRSARQRGPTQNNKTLGRPKNGIVHDEGQLPLRVAPPDDARQTNRTPHHGIQSRRCQCPRRPHKWHRTPATGASAM